MGERDGVYKGVMVVVCSSVVGVERFMYEFDLFFGDECCVCCVEYDGKGVIWC